MITVQLRSRTPPQKRISQSKARFNVAAWGRQSGKTTFGIDKMIWKPLEGRPWGVYWYVLQTYSAAEVAYSRYTDLFRTAPNLLLKPPNKSEMSVQLANGAKVWFKSGEVLQNLRAETLDGAIIDEVRQQQPELWPQIIRPMLARRNGWADFYSTPNGFDHFYDLHNQAMTDPEWAAFHSPSTEAWWWTDAEVASARKQMSEAEFAQEIMAEFRDLSQSSAYVSHGSWNWRDSNPFSRVPNEIASPFLPVVLACDFNVSPMAWTIGQFRLQESHWFDEIWIKKTHTQEAAAVFVDKFLRLGIRANPGVIIVGDATGRANKTAASGQTDYTILCRVLDRAGIRWENRTPEANPPVKDRVNTLNAALRSADGTTQLTYNPRTCPMLKRDLERVRWKEGTSAILDQTTNPDLTHSTDGVGYAVCALAPLKPSGNVGRLLVIRR